MRVFTRAGGVLVGIGRQFSDQATRDNLLAEAARHHAEAAEIETGVKTWAANGALRGGLISSSEVADVRFGS
jgi:hypothetical protein